MKRAFSLLAVGVVLAARVAWADCGSIPFKADVQIFEPNQRAVIAFNGRAEILLLSTDLRASEPTKVLEVIPFPSEPKVTKGDVEVFRNATDLINQKLSPRLARGMRFGGMGGAGGVLAMGEAPPPAGEVTLKNRIGAHDVSVTHVLEPGRFVEWVEDYLKKSGVDNPTIPRPLKLVVDEYLRDGFKWFAFNVVELGTTTATKDAVQYRFNTRFLYYPLRITRSETGSTTVRLVLISPRLVKIPERLPARARLMHPPVTITPDELRYLDKEIYGLLGKKSSMLLRTWEIKGRLAGFRKDVVTTWY